MAAALDVLGHLTILADGGRPLRVEFRGDVVALEIPDLRAALALRGRMRRSERRAWLRRVQAALGLAGLELHIRVGRRQVGRLAAGTRPGRLAAWLGLDPVELKVRPVLAVLARLRAGTVGGNLIGPQETGDGTSP
jgi:hypothetical protein